MKAWQRLCNLGCRMLGAHVSACRCGWQLVQRPACNLLTVRSHSRYAVSLEIEPAERLDGFEYKRWIAAHWACPGWALLCIACSSKLAPGAVRCAEPGLPRPGPVPAFYHLQSTDAGDLHLHASQMLAG